MISLIDALALDNEIYILIMKMKNHFNLNFKLLCALIILIEYRQNESHI